MTGDTSRQVIEGQRQAGWKQRRWKNRRSGRGVGHRWLLQRLHPSGDVMLGRLATFWHLVITIILKLINDISCHFVRLFVSPAFDIYIPAVSAFPNNFTGHVCNSGHNTQVKSQNTFNKSSVSSLQNVLAYILISTLDTSASLGF